MAYNIKRNYGGCKGYAVVGPGGPHGCHPSRKKAIEQQRALYAAEAQAKKSHDGTVTNENTPNKYPEHSLDNCPDPKNCQDHMSNKKIDENEMKHKKKKEMHKSLNIKENYPGCDGFAVVDDSGSINGCFKTRAEAEAAAMPQDGNEDNSQSHDNQEIMNVDKQSPCWDGYVQRGMKPGKNGTMVPNCIPVKKSQELQECCPDQVMKKQLTNRQTDTFLPSLGI
jgi:hypothetical protein